MDPCKGKEPKVIDNALIEKCIKEQGPKGEAGRLAQLEGVPVEEVEQIRFEFLNILRIDHLWVFTSLKKLSLNNNNIEKIENLESLVNLTELDFSFNKISKIENLDSLTSIEKLNFFDNQIRIIENLDNLTKLTILSIGRNYLDDLDNIIYLRQFKNLKSLNLAENPFTENENFRIFIAAFLPQVIYYEYKLIQESERQNGLDKFSKKLHNLLEEETAELVIKQAKEKELADAELHAHSFVEYLNSRYLFDSLFEDDEEGRILLEIGDEIQEYYTEYEEQFINTCKQIFNVGQEQFSLRQQEIDQFMKCVEEAKTANQTYSIEHMEIFLEEKFKIFTKLKSLQKDLEKNTITIDDYDEAIEEYAVVFNESIHKVWKNLMKHELELYEQMDEIIQNFGHSLTEMVDSFLEASQALFSQIRALEVTYMENISECASRYFANTNISENFVIPEVLKPIMTDKDVLYNALGATHNLHMQLIDNREDVLVSRAKEWLENFLSNLEKDEIKRNRGKILEINHFLDIQREEFDELIIESGPNLDPDVSAALT